MTMKRQPWFALMAWLLAAPPVLSMDAAQERGERARIRAEQAQVEAEFAGRERACRERFVVTSCVDAARRERRQALESLRRQLEVLDAAERKQRAAERAEQIRSKISGGDTRRREAVVRERRKHQPRAELSDRSLPGRASASAPAPAASGSIAGGEQKRADYERRLQKAREHKEQVQRRQAERAASGKPPALALPVPAPVPAPAR